LLMNRPLLQEATTILLLETYEAKQEKRLLMFELLLYPAPFSLKNCLPMMKSRKNVWLFPKSKASKIYSRE
jgi:hypothetical protein